MLLLAGTLSWVAMPSAQALTTEWLPSATGNWSDDSNWSAGVPGPLDLAIVTPATQPFSGGMVIDAATTIGDLVLSNAGLTVKSHLTVTGSFAWTEVDNTIGYFLGSGVGFIPDVRFLGTNSLTGNGTKFLNHSMVFETGGTTSWAGNSIAGGNDLMIGLNGTTPIWNNTGVFTDANELDTSLSGTGAFNNLGNFVKAGGAVTVVDIATFNNAGSMLVQAGTLQFTVLTGEQNGSWHIDAGGTLEISGGASTLTGPISGTGDLLISGGTHAIEGYSHTAHLILDGGTLGGAFNVFDGAFTWKSGTLAGEGTSYFTSTISLEGADTLYIDEGRHVISYGQTTWSGSVISMGEGLGGNESSFTNNGVFLDVADASQHLNGNSGNLNRFVNYGTYEKTGTGTTFVNSSVQFENLGTLRVNGGLLRISGTFSNSGLIELGTGGGLLGLDPAGFINTGTISGNGNFQMAAISNQGLISPGTSIGHLTLSGDVTLASGGTLKVELGALDEYDLLTLTGDATLGGVLEISNLGYNPHVGDRFTVLTFASLLGYSEFDAVHLDGFGPGVSFDVIYNAKDVTLLVTSVPEPATYALWITGMALTGLMVRRRSPAG